MLLFFGIGSAPEAHPPLAENPGRGARCMKPLIFSGFLLFINQESRFQNKK